MADDRFIFVVQWYDTAASLVRTYNFTYYAIDKTIQMFDIKNKKIFLKRCQYPSVQLKDLFIGSILTVYSRQLKIVGYTDQFTRKKFEIQKGRTYAMIKPDCYMNIGKIISIIQSNNFTLGNLKIVKMAINDSQQFYAQHKGKPFYQQLTKFIASDLVVGLQLISEDCIKKWRQLLGPTNIKVAKSQKPNSIRALFGQQGVRNACHGSDSVTSAQRQLDFVFSPKSNLKSPALFSNCTCCVIKPHIISEGKVGQIIDIIITQGFQISAMQMFWLDRPSAQEFLQIYKGVVPEYNQLVDELTTGPCIALQVRQQNVVKSFRQLCGPHDSQLARTVRPKSIRALFGRDKIKNAVHCTDLEDDGILEVQYFFNILQR